MNPQANHMKRGQGRPSNRTARNDALPQVPAFDQQKIYAQNGQANGGSAGARRDLHANSQQNQQPPSQMVLFANEDQRREFYQNQNLEVPQFSTLSSDVIPSQHFLDRIDEHQPKIDPSVIEQIWRSAGVQTQDERVIKAASVMVEMQLSKIVQELKIVAAHSQHKQKHGASNISGPPSMLVPGSAAATGGSAFGSHHAKTILTYEDLQKSMDEFGVSLRKPPFLAESAKVPSMKRSSLQGGSSSSLQRTGPTTMGQPSTAQGQMSQQPPHGGQQQQDLSRQQK